MMLRARFVRWCHLMKFLILFVIGRAELPHCAIDLTCGWRTLHVGCTCGKAWE